MKEANIVAAIQQHFSRNGEFIFKTHGDLYSKAGMPDLVGTYQGRFVGIEVKKPGEHLRPLQRVMLRRISAAKGGAFYVINLEQLIEQIKEWELANFAPRRID